MIPRRTVAVLVQSPHELIDVLRGQVVAELLEEYHSQVEEGD
jgi:hypothetical protein